MVMLSAIYLLFPATLKHNNMVFIYNPTQMLISTETVEKPDFESSVLLRNPNFLVCSIG
jgi:hypothetical protein